MKTKHQLRAIAGLCAALACSPLAIAQTGPGTTTSTSETANTAGITTGNRPDARNYSWIGLLGLVGLAGLMRRKPDPQFTTGRTSTAH